MAEQQAAPPHAGKRLTRGDVERLIEENRGPEGLDLRKADLRHANLKEARLGSANLQGADLTAASIEGANLRLVNLEGARLDGANLQGADLSFADLQGAAFSWANLQRALLYEANLRRAVLYGANLQQADFRRTNLQRVRLTGASLRDANLEGANWGDYKLGEEMNGDFADAASIYRTLKQWHSEAGMYDVAAEFHYREMEARRRLAWYGDLFAKERRPLYAVSLDALRFLYGYGERPERVIGWAAGITFGLALVHWVFGTVAGGFWDALYYSAVSFTALGYGAWAPEPQGWAGRFLGVGEAGMGVFMMALFLVTFTRKMTR